MIRPNEIRTTTIAAAIVIIAATTVMISTAVAIRTAIGIKTEIGTGIQAAFGRSRETWTSFSRLSDVFFRLSTHRSNVCRTLVTGTAGNRNRLYKHRIILYAYFK